jgi:parallel beta-helix repeat protein
MSMNRTWLSVGIILLFVGTCMIPVIAQDTEKSKSSRGNWLYVGGSGPGNYTKIQDAIDAASDGDTVFVYTQSSPYAESIQINVSLRLIGENRSTTAITGNKKSTAVIINASNVTLSGFTIANPYWNDDIWILGDHATVQSNIIKDAEIYGIRVGGNSLLICANSTVIQDNIICNNSYQGIELVSYNSTVRQNMISHNACGISVYFGQRNSLVENQLSENDCAISIEGKDNLIQRNTIFNNSIGIWTCNGPQNRILANNIYDDSHMASETIRILHLAGDLRNIWDGNYWGKSYTKPKPIPTYIFLDFLILWRYYIHNDYTEYNVTIKGGYDFHPAQTPYDIP